MASKNKNSVDDAPAQDDNLSPDELLSKEAEKDRARVLEEDPAIAINREVAESSNAELAAADRFVNTEKTTPAERASFANRAVVTNHTPAGLAADIHQALVVSSNLHRNEAMAYRDIQAVVRKYEESYENERLPGDVLTHLENEMDKLETAAKLDEDARTLLEKYT